MRRKLSSLRAAERLAKDEPRFDPELRAFHPRTYNLKAIADYATGPGPKVPTESAREAIQTARRGGWRRSSR